jgi:hypothetical protein
VRPTIDVNRRVLNLLLLLLLLLPPPLSLWP